LAARGRWRSPRLPFLLDAEVPEPVQVRPARGGVPPARPARLALETRIRAALWFAVHLAAGGVVALVWALALPRSLVVVAHRLGVDSAVLTGLRFGPLDDHDTRWWSLIGLLLLVVTVYAVAGLGALAALMAPVLLGPSPAERIAALEAGSRRLAERNRLARDLHDSIGHALTATTLQAAAARELFDAGPAFARRALEAIEAVGRGAIDDLDHVLGVLRDHGREPDHRRDREGAARQPPPTLVEAERLCDGVRASGVDVTLDVGGRLADVPGVVSRLGYRIVQEGLTNAARHAGRVPVTLRMAVSDEALEIDITNPVVGQGTGRRGGGQGLDGMRERVDLLGGRLNAGGTDGFWRVAVRLPFGGDIGQGDRL
jgi:signal transduction histidine kinase